MLAARCSLSVIVFGRGLHHCELIGYFHQKDRACLTRGFSNTEFVEATSRVNKFHNEQVPMETPL